MAKPNDGLIARPRYHRHGQSRTLRARRRRLFVRVRSVALTAEETVMEQRRIASVRSWIAFAAAMVGLLAVGGLAVYGVSSALITDAVEADTLQVKLMVAGVLMVFVGGLGIAVVALIRFFQRRKPVALMTSREWQHHQAALIVGDMTEMDSK